MIRRADLLLPPDSPPIPEPHRFATSDGYDLGYRLWRPPNPRAIVVALHGIQSHSGWYGWSSLRLAEAGYAVAYLDRRGSGVNAAERGDAPHAERLIGDVIQFVAHLERCGLGGLPKVLAAVSWGGKLAAALSARRPDTFASLALITPGLCTRIRANAAQRTALRAAGIAGFGRRLVPIPLQDPSLFTDDPSFQSFIRQDALTLRHVTVRFLNVGLTLDRFLRTKNLAIRCPTALFLAGQDRIVDNAATIDFLHSLADREVTVREYASARHTLEFEPSRNEFFRDLGGWIERSLQL